MTYKSDLPVIVTIPDTQVKPGVPTEHMGWIGKYVVDTFKGHADCTVVHLGDHFDFPSLSSYDKGKKAMEGRRLREDLDAGNAAFRLLDRPISKAKGWKPRKILTLGNHEARLTRALEDNAQLDGIVGLGDLDTGDWEVHPFLSPVFTHGIGFSHYWVQPLTGRPIGGMMETRLKTLGHSFVAGHQQVTQYGLRPIRTSTGESTFQHGLISGSCYAHDEEYLGFQGNDSWRGIIVHHEVQNGSYCPMFVSLDYLSRRYGDYEGLLDYQRAYGVRV